MHLNARECHTRDLYVHMCVTYTLYARWVSNTYHIITVGESQGIVNRTNAKIRISQGKSSD